MVSFTALTATAMLLLASAASAVNVQLTRQDFRNQFKNEEFAFDLAKSGALDIGFGTKVRVVGRKQQPSLDQEGLFYALVHVDACGIVVPHIHPRGSELDFLIHGGPLRNVFAEELGSTRVVQYDLQPGQTGLIPQGLLHVQFNLGCKPLAFLAALSSDDAGLVAIGSTDQFPLQDPKISVPGRNATGQVRKLEAALGELPFETRQKCLARCNIRG